MDISYAIVVRYMHMYNLLAKTVDRNIRKVTDRKGVTRIKIYAHGWRVYVV